MAGHSPPNVAASAGRSCWPVRLSVTAALLSTAAAVLVGAWAMSDHRTWSLVENTLLLIGGTLALSLPVGILLAVLLFRTDAPGRRTVLVLLGIMLVVPLYLQAAAWEAGFGPSGWFTALAGNPYEQAWLSGWWGAAWVHALAAIPWIVLIVGVAVRWVEPELEEVALLDVSGWQVLLRVTLRRALPAIGLAAVWIALVVGTEMTVSDLFQTGTTRLRTYAEEIYTEFALGAPVVQSPPDLVKNTKPSQPASNLYEAPTATWVGLAVSSCLTACALLMCLAAARWRAPPTDRRPLMFHLGRWRPAALLVIALAVVLVVGLPLASLIVKAGVSVRESAGQYSRQWSLRQMIEVVAGTPERYRREIGSSALIAALAASLVTLVAVPLGWLARHYRAAAVAALVLAAVALAIPGPLLGLELIALFNRPGATWLNFLYDRTVAVPVVAQAVRAFPLGILIVWRAFDSLPSELLEVAALDGAGPWQRFWLVAWPLRWPALALAWLGAFVVAIGELSATIMVVPPGVQTLGVRISQLLHFNMQDKLAALCLLLMLAAAALAGLLLALSRRVGHRN